MFVIGVQVFDATMAQALHQDACRNHTLIAWIVTYDDPAFPDRFIARLATTAALPCIVVGNTLADVRRQPNPPGAVEIWLGS